MGNEYHTDCVVPTVKRGGGSVKIWGCMAADGVGEMVVCESRLNSAKYIQTFETALMPSLTSIFGDTNSDGVIFQQDNAPYRKSATTLRWFTDNNIDLLDWPAHSPDLNPIEHLWGILKRRIKEYNITSKTSFKNALLQEWHGMPSQVRNALRSHHAR
ncbi:hypothetical protein PYW07_003295 [Mythimna separata]|uniref:Tc1-like transposase DDE domain-containing protein n=1 Tax=Mythimna separata TaxID=271217 RepID=A0AAD7YJE7_MYTSE|nr:hypothetical protein PYW07_003295 [Mythimna separata]